MAAGGVFWRGVTQRLEIEGAVASSKLRYSPGVALGGSELADVTGKWLKGSQGNLGRIPGQVARALQGRQFKNFDEFRSAFWEEVSKNPNLAGQFDPSGRTNMAGGKAPFAVKSQQVGGQKRYVLHHVTPIQRGGGVYDLDNIVVVTPRYHLDALARDYHMGK